MLGFWGLATAACAQEPPVAPAHTPETPAALAVVRHVLVLNSYHATYPITEREMAGIRAALEPLAGVELHPVFMDTKRLVSPEYLAQLAQLYQTLFAKVTFSGIVATDNDALAFLLRYRATLLPAVPVVFSGINDFSLERLHGATDITGVTENSDYAGTAKVAARLCPAARRLVIVVDDTTTGQAHRAAAVKDAVRFPSQLQPEFWSLADMTLADLASRLHALDRRSVVMLLQHVRDRTGTVHDVSASAAALCQASGAPVFVVSDTRLGTGAVGGLLISGYDQGYAAGKMMERILKGAAPASIPVAGADTNRHRFDYRALERWGIPERALPRDSIIEFRPPSLWHDHPDDVLAVTAAFAILAGLLVGLIVSNRQRARIQESLRQREAYVRRVVDNLPHPVIVVGADGRLEMINPAFVRTFGYSLPDVPTTAAWFSRAYPDPAYRQEVLNVWQADTDSGTPGRALPRTFAVTVADGSVHHVVFRLVSMEAGRSLVLAEDVTEQLRAERALHDSEARYRTLFETTAVGVVYMDTGGRIIDANPAAECILGVSRPDLLKRTAADPNWQAIHEDGASFPPEEHPVFRALGTGQPVRNVVMGVWNPVDRRRRWILINATPLFRNGEPTPYQVYATFLDVTARKEAEEALRRSEAQFHSLFANMAEGVALHRVILGPDGKPVNYQILDVNPQYECILGLKRDAVRNKLATEAYGTPEVPYLQEFCGVGVGGQPHRLETYFAPMDKYFVISVAPLDRGYFATIFWDVTQARQQEKKLQALLQELAQHNREMEMILYVTSHDLRSPLVNLDGFGGILDTSCQKLMEALAAAAIPEATRQRIAVWAADRIPKSVKHILTSTRKMNSLVNGLLQVSRTGRAVLHIQPLDMRALVAAVLHALAYQLQEVKAHVDVQNLPDCAGDACQLNQVLTNLIGNAIKYRDPTRELEITVSGKLEGTEATYCVADNGIGMAPAYHHKIWEMFQRLDPDDGKPGEGIGLTLVRRIVERHGGRCWVESEEGQGSRFYVTCPTAVPPPSAHAGTAA